MKLSNPLDADEPVYSGMLHLKILFAVLLMHFCCLLAVYLHHPKIMLIDDNQIGTMPICVEMGRLLRNGEMPLLNEHSWHANGIAGEYTSAFFHPPFWVYCILVSMKIVSFECYALMWIEWSYLVLLTGTFLLARELKLSPHVAGLVTMLMASSGYLFALAPAWFVILQSFAYLPWCWWSISKASASSSLNQCLQRSSIAGLALGMLITSGWTFTDIMALLVYAFVYFQLLLSRQFILPTFACVFSGILGLGLSSPSWLMLIEYSSWSHRLSELSETTPSVSFLHFQDYLNLIYPVTGYLFDNFNCSIVSNGSIPTLIIIWGIITYPRVVYREWMIFLFLLLAMCICMFPDMHPLRWLFRFLPLLHLLMCLIAGILVQRHASIFTLSNFKRVILLVLLASVCILLTLLSKLGILRLSFTLPVPVWYPYIWLALVVLSGYIVFNASRNISIYGMGIASMMITTATMLAYTPAWGFRINTPVELTDKGLCTYPTWYLSNYSPSDPGIYSDYHRFFPGGINNYAKIKTINGYSTMGPMSTTGFFNIGDIGFDFSPESIFHNKINSSSLLQWMAIDGLILNPQLIPVDVPKNEFTKVGIQDGYEIWHRNTGPSPVYHTHKKCIIGNALHFIVGYMTNYDAETCALDNPKIQTNNNNLGRMKLDPFKSLELVSQNNSQMIFKIDTHGNSQASLITISRPWLPGYKASINGKPVTLYRASTLMPAVLIPSGQSGKLIIEYKPDSWIYGWYWSMSSLCIAIGLIYRFGHANKTKTISKN